MSKVLILGPTGLLGQTVLKEFQNVNFETYTAGRNNNSDVFVDATNYFESVQNISKFCIKNKINYAINCIGLLVQYSELNREEAMFVNGIFPNLLSLKLFDLNVKLIHISTDCVFSGDKGNYNSKIDFPDPKDFYGFSKYVGEFSSKNCMVIRTSIIGPDQSINSQGLFNWFINNTEKTVDGYLNQIWSGVTTKYLANFLIGVIKNKSFSKGIFNLSTKPISKYHLLKLISKHFNIKVRINKKELPKKIDKSLVNDFKDIHEIQRQLIDLSNDDLFKIDRF